MKSRKPEGVSGDQFSLELENLYREIKDRQIVEVGPEGEPDLAPYYELFRVSPDASHEELKAAYTRLAQSWRPEKFADHPEWKEKAEDKLNAINKAYETILSARIRQIKRYRKSLPLTEIEKESEPVENEEQDYTEVSRPARFGLKKALIFAAVPVFVLFCYFMISSLFDRPQRKPALENVLPPVSRAVPAQPAEPAAKPQTALSFDKQPETGPQKPALEKPATPPLASIPERRPAAAAPAKKSEPVRTAPKTIAKPAPAPSAAAAKQPSAGGVFSVQVGLVKDRVKAEEYIARVKKDGLSARMAESKLASGEKAYRILIGKFSTREEAVAFIAGNSLKERYPGSFIQKSAP